MKFIRIFTAISLAICFFSANAQRNTKKIHDAKLPLDPAIKTGKLPNGFTYFIRKNSEPVDRAMLLLIVKAGSILEEPNQLGLAHFIEHMSFKGTKNFPDNELSEYLQKSGVRFGADLNAYTSSHK
jgi:zinc protease